MKLNIFSIKNNRDKHKRSFGFALIEIVIATALVSILTLALVSVTQKALQLSDRALKQSQASFLLEEGAESVKTIRDNDWADIDSLVLGTEYYLYYDINLNLWTLSATPNNIDGVFTRTIIFDAAYRDGSDDLSSSGTIDDFSRKVIVKVSWASSSGGAAKELSFYIVDLFN